MAKYQEMEGQLVARVGQNIKIARRMRGLTLQKIGESIGVSYQQMQKYEAGRSKISITNLFMLSQKLEVPISFFFKEFNLEELMKVHLFNKD